MLFYVYDTETYLLMNAPSVLSLISYYAMSPQTRNRDVQFNIV